MTRENAEAKGRRYVVEGRLAILDVTGDSIDAVCRGNDGAVYTIRHRRRGGWTCSCPAVGRCAHRVAAGLVVVTTPFCSTRKDKQ